MLIRPGRSAELEELREIERAAGRWFRDIGMAAIAEDEPPSVDELHAFRKADGLWVSAAPDGRPVAYVLLEPVDGGVHIEQLSVHPDSARRGIGRALLDHVAARAAADGVPALTLTTFTEVPWNAPYYERCGFRRLAEAELTPGLRRIREREAELGLDRWPRVCMRREVPPA